MEEVGEISQTMSVTEWRICTARHRLPGLCGADTLTAIRCQNALIHIQMSPFVSGPLKNTSMIICVLCHTWCVDGVIQGQCPQHRHTNLKIKYYITIYFESTNEVFMFWVLWPFTVTLTHELIRNRTPVKIGLCRDRCQTQTWQRWCKHSDRLINILFFFFCVNASEAHRKWTSVNQPLSYTLTLPSPMCNTANTFNFLGVGFHVQNSLQISDCF